MIKTSSRSILNSLRDRCIETTTKCGDGQLVWRVWNKNIRKLPAIVLLHGGFGSWNHWVRTIPSLEGNYRVIAPDLPGCGDSHAPPQPYNAASLAGIVSKGLDKVVPDNEPFDLVSFSFGGVLSGLIAQVQSRRIRSLTLVGSPILGLTSTGPANQLVAVSSNLPLPEAKSLYRSNLQKLMVYNPDAADNLALTIHMDNMAKSRLRSRGIARTTVLAESLKELPCKLMCIFGENDVTLHPDLAGIRAYVDEVCPNVDFYIIPHAGHWVQFEASICFNALLKKILLN